MNRHTNCVTSLRGHRMLLQVFLRTRGMARLNLRSQVFEISNCFGSTNDLIAFECVKTISVTEFLTTKLFEIRNNLTRFTK